MPQQLTPTLLLSVPELFSVLSSATHPLARCFSAPPDNATDLQRFQAEAISTMRSIWANNTWNQRISLQGRLDAFRKFHHLSDKSDLALDWSIILFATSTRTIPSSRMTYVKSLAALYRRQEHDLPLCSLFSTALRATATIPTHQAVPATMEAVDRAIQLASDNTRLQLAIWIAFKTASRADEVFRLTRKAFLVNEPNEIVIEWMGNTKTSRLDPWRTSSWVVIHHHAPMTHFNKIISGLDEDSPLLDMPTTHLTSWLSRDNSTRSLSAQSFKRGALTYLAQMAIGGLLDLSLIPRLAKHKVEFDVFPATTLRYLGDRVILAKLLRTQEATVLIPCFPHPPTSQNVPCLTPSPPSTPISPTSRFLQQAAIIDTTDEQEEEAIDPKTLRLRANLAKATTITARNTARRLLLQHQRRFLEQQEEQKTVLPNMRK